MDVIELHGQAARDFIALLAAGVSVDEAYELVTDDHRQIAAGNPVPA